MQNSFTQKIKNKIGHNIDQIHEGKLTKTVFILLLKSWEKALSKPCSTLWRRVLLKALWQSSFWTTSWELAQSTALAATCPCEALWMHKIKHVVLSSKARPFTFKASWAHIKFQYLSYNLPMTVQTHEDSAV